MSEPDILAQAMREHPDPHEQRNPVPGFLVAIVGAVLATCIFYIAFAQVETPSAWGDGRTRAELAGTRPAAGSKADGAATFAASCAACHQAAGTGLPGVFPPLAGSEWVSGRDSTVAAIVLNGITGSLTVKGSTYNGAMPTFKAQLDDEHVAAVLTWVRGRWGNASPPVTPAVVAKARDDTKARTAPFNGDADLHDLK